MTDTVAPTLSRRERNRINTAAEIKDLARQQMAADGAAALSLRAIARAMGMTAPAIYRYFPSRDDLVTALIVDAYDSLADTLAAVDAPIPPDHLGDRLFAFARAYRSWAFTHPADYILILGTPIPNYHAPFEITQPAAFRSILTLVDIIVAARARNDPHLLTELAAISTPGVESMPVRLIHDIVAIGATLFGLISIELYGHTNDMAHLTEAIYDGEVLHIAERLGIARSSHPDATDPASTHAP